MGKAERVARMPDSESTGSAWKRQWRVSVGVSPSAPAARVHLLQDRWTGGCACGTSGCGRCVPSARAGACGQASALCRRRHQSSHQRRGNPRHRGEPVQFAHDSRRSRRCPLCRRWCRNADADRIRNPPVIGRIGMGGRYTGNGRRVSRHECRDAAGGNERRGKGRADCHHEG